MRKIFFVLILFSLTITSFFAEERYSIDYYGIVATEIDSNMSKMTSDLYYTQLCEINNFVINDKRVESSMKAAPDKASLSAENLSFYTEITKKENSSKWVSTLKLINPTTNKTESQTKEYDSFYKILMEPKSVLHESILNLLENKQNSAANNDDFLMPEKQSGDIESTEFLSGTWSGEDSIDKIVIMRGGRGFVIFTNGASMNITVEIKNTAEGKKILIKQNGRANASFFPELSRTVALKEAVNASPVTWLFSIVNDNTLSGTKNTLIESNGAAIRSDINVTWKKRS
ncbi:MAG: hypothetical protein J5527_01580 [Treponema sp.]|nr:hypothetical protein [Treponema sp.]